MTIKFGGLSSKGTDMKIMYLTHVNWFWIFQRPQILALFLEKDFDVTVYSKKVLFKPLLSKDNKTPRKLKTIIQLPKENTFKFFKLINRLIYSYKLKNVYNFDIFWICHPLQYPDIPEDYKGVVVYDCMDNHASLANEEDKEQVKQLEEKLINRADIVFVSSNYLQEHVLKDKKSFLVRNGYNYTTIVPPMKACYKECYTIGYFGTISAWFDIELLRFSLENVGNIQYKLIGPNDTSFIGENSISLEGVVQHNELGKVIKDFDALIMPFVVNDIILAVDPVKLYEYISFGKCIISVWYPEIDRFSPYVYFYNNPKEFTELLNKLKNSGFKPKYDERQQADFLKSNSWKDRYDTIKKIMVSFMDERIQRIK